MIYYDNAATTHLCESAKKILQNDYGNPSSPHIFGLEAEREVKKTVKKLSTVLSCRNDEVYFTSGGTESNNLGILGAAFALKSSRQRSRALHILASNQEHPSVTEPLRFLSSLPGYAITFADPSLFANYINEDTAMICVTHINSETGDIPNYIKNNDILTFVDGAQGFCKIPVPP